LLEVRAGLTETIDHYVLLIFHRSTQIIVHHGVSSLMPSQRHNDPIAPIVAYVRAPHAKPMISAYAET
jgi:hypothetical protein